MNTTAQPNATSEIDSFLERLIEEKNFSHIAPEIHDQIKKDLTQELNDYIDAKVIAALSDKDLEGFEKLVDADASQDQIQSYVAEKIPDGASFFANLLLEFRKTYLGLI